MNQILSFEQKGCCKGSKGCKEQLIIDGIITSQVKTKSRNISLAWIDYKKAFDSVPHSWLIEILKIYKISDMTIKLLQSLMSKWNTTLKLNELTSNPILVQRGIFQGDSLSPLWF